MSGLPSPESSNPPCDISFSSENFTVEFDLDGGVAGIQEGSSQPSTLLYGQTGQKNGDWDPSHSHLEQRDWSGGRGGEYFSDDDTKFNDASAYTLTPNKLHNSLLRQFGYGIRSNDTFWPSASFQWIPIYGSTGYLDTPFLASASYSADKAYLRIRKVGNPPNALTLVCAPDSSGDPGAAAKTTTITRDDITDELEAVKAFNWTTTWSLTSGTKYHLKAYSTGGTVSNHWEVGVGNITASAEFPTKTSSDGTTWVNSAFCMFFRVVDADVRQRWMHFILEGVHFAVNSRADGTASTVYVNGDQGYADSNSGDKTALNDATKTWTTNDWLGYRVRVIAGPGLNEDRQILYNTATVLVVDKAWDKTHTTDTRYSIYGGPKWTLCTLSVALSGVVSDVAVFQNQAIFCQGGSIAMLRMHIKSDATYESAAVTTTYADYAHCYRDGNNGNVLWKGFRSASTVARSNTAAWGAALSFGSEIAVGDSSFAITNLGDHDGALYVHKEDSVWKMESDKPVKIPIGTEASPSSTNGLVSISRNQFYHFNWSHSLERIYGSTVDDYGPWKGSGLPSNRRGPAVDGVGVIQNIYYAFDAGAGISHSLAYNERWFHEIFRGFENAQSCDGVFWQPVPGGNPMLWLSYGGDMVYLKFPRDTMNPLNDTNILYEPEGYIDLTTMDMSLTQLPKVFKDVDIISQNVRGDGVDLFYQRDDEIGTSVWHFAGTSYKSPVAKIKVGIGDTRAIRYRLRMTANDIRRPPVITTIISKMFARSPVTRTWSLRCKAGGTRRNGRMVRGNELDRIYEFMWKSCQGANYLMMHSKYPGVDGIPVVIEPPTFIRTALNTFMRMWKGTIILNVREV